MWGAGGSTGSEVRRRVGWQREEGTSQGGGVGALGGREGLSCGTRFT